jgi:hypothetical protein
MGLAARKRPLSPLAWALFAAVVVCQLAVRSKYFVFQGVSWSVAGQWLTLSLYAATMGLLLPLTLGLRLAERYGRAAMLFLIGMVWVGFQVLIDVDNRVSEQIGGTLAFTAYGMTVPFLFTVVAPLWYLRVGSCGSRVRGFLVWIGVAVLFDLIVMGWSYRGELPLIIWISFVPYTGSVLLTLALGHLLYRRQSGCDEPQWARRLIGEVSPSGEGW